MTIYLISEPPNFCPECGHSLEWSDIEQRADFYAGAAHTCNCGAHFAYANAQALLNTADRVGSDMSDYVEA